MGTPQAQARIGVEVDPGGVGVRVGPRDRDRDRRCKTVTTREWRDGRRVTRTVRRCGGRDRDFD